MPHTEAFWDAEPEERQSESQGKTSGGKVFVDEISIGDHVDSQFVIHRLSLREYDKGKFLSLRLGDRTGKINAVLWNHAEETHRRIEEGSLVHAAGKVNSYQNEPQITLDRLEPIDPSELDDPGAFLPASPVPLDDMIAEFDAQLAAILDEDFHRLLTEFRNDEEMWRGFSTAPGAKLWHHPYLHGLLEHTLSVLRLCRAIAPNYEGVDADLLVTGAVFHDVGKTREFIYDFRVDYSTEGRLCGHVYIGAAMVERLIARLPGFPAEKRRLLMHLILSHHGETERSPILPMTIEALLLHNIENMDAQTAAFQREMNKARGGGKTWTGFVNLIGRYLYLGEELEEDDGDGGAGEE